MVWAAINADDADAASRWMKKPGVDVWLKDMKAPKLDDIMTMILNGLHHIISYNHIITIYIWV